MPTPDRYRALVIGCGRIGSQFDETAPAVVSSHAGAIRAEPRAILAGLCDSNPDRLRAAGEFWQVASLYQKPREALSAVAPEIVCVCTPDETHTEMISMALECESVRAILAEKPLATSASAARSLAEAAERRGVALVVNYSRRFQSAFRRVRDDLAGGRIGAIQVITGYYSRGIRHNGTHWIDLARWLAGEIARVESFKGVDEIADDPTLDVRFEFTSGARGVVLGVDQRCFALFEMDIIGARGRLRILPGPRFTWWERRERSDRPGFAYLSAEEDDRPVAEGPTMPAVQNVCDVLDGLDTPRCSAADAVRALEVAEACMRSAERREPVSADHDASSRQAHDN